MEQSLRNVSPWSFRQQVARMLWGVVQGTLFRWSFYNFNGFRVALLRLFGARIGRNVRIRRTVFIEIPWHLTLGDDVTIGSDAILYCLGPITIGDRTLISQYAQLCAGSHDYLHKDFLLTRPPITIGSDAWIATDAFVGPGVTIGDGTILGARSSVFKDLPPWMVCVGNPAKPIKPRPRV